MTRALSRRLSWVLRHGANEVGLVMDPAGWVAVDDLLRWGGLDRATLEQVVTDNDKHRLQLDGDRIRACQGHSPRGVPVTLEALEASWEPVVGRTDPLYHGTRWDLTEVILREGLRAMDRTHVHLAGSRADKVGKRAHVDVLVVVSSERLAQDGIPLFRSPNGVYLARYVPPDCLLGLEGP